MVREPNLIKVCLENQGEDSETPWAHDLGPAKGPKGSRKVRLVNVPFLHAKPTWGDVIVVAPVEDGPLTWDSKGVPWSKIHTRIAEDGGRWAMIVDYLPHDRTDGEVAFQSLHRACMDQDVICEGAWGPIEDKPGRAYFAAPEALDEHDVMVTLTSANLPCALTLIHPQASARPATKSRAQTASREQPARKAGANKPRTKNGPASKSAAKTTRKKSAAAATKSAAKTTRKKSAAAAKKSAAAAKKSAAKTTRKKSAPAKKAGAKKPASKSARARQRSRRNARRG